MATKTATGASKKPDARAAAEKAVLVARAQLDEPPAFGLLFCSPSHDPLSALLAAREAADGADLIACTTAGELTERGTTHDGVACMLVTGEDVLHELRFASGAGRTPADVAQQLTDGLPQIAAAAARAGMPHAASILLTDGVAPTGEELALALYEGAQNPAQQLVGAAAGDEGAFRETIVGAGGTAGINASAVLHIFGARRWGIGHDHGLVASAERLGVTRSEQTTVHELDGRPAFEAYRAHAAANGVDLAPDETAGEYLIAHPLGIMFRQTVVSVRSALAVTEEGGLELITPVREGSQVCILDGKAKNLTRAAHGAALQAKESLGGAPAAGVLLFECAFRGMVIEDEFAREIGAIRSVFPDTPIAGLVGYGQIARDRGAHSGWHNATSVVVAIPR